MSKIKRTERGWAGHFCCAHRCLFRRNTLLESGDRAIVVSTVGLMMDPLAEGSYREIGYERYYETRAFEADPADQRYRDADVTKEVSFDSPWAIDFLDADDRANDMHEAVVKEISCMLRGQ